MTSLETSAPRPVPAVGADFERTVFHAELDLITKRRRDGRDAEHTRTSLAGLALSGGGIRSATFGLGVLQALGRVGVVEQCDYLSTVSGGGYIGACLSSLTADGTLDATPGKFPFLRDGPEESMEVVHLRRHSEYLAPQHGLFTADTWMLVSSYVRGLLLSMLTVTALIALVALAVLAGLPRVIGLMSGSDGFRALDDPQVMVRALFAPAGVLIALWVLATTYYLVTTRGNRSLDGRRASTKVQAAFLGGAAGLAALGGLPFLFKWVSDHVIGTPFFTGVSIAGVWALVQPFILGKQAATIPALVRKALVALAASAVVALVWLFVVYGIWAFRHDGAATLLILAVVLGVLIVGLVAVDINRVSMHYFYRDRLSDAYIIRRPAASPEPDDRRRKARVDSNDGLLLSDLAAERRVPYHLINATLNLSGSTHRELRGRKAGFFLYSPLYCGSTVTGYQRTTDYAGGRIKLATAMSVSGAAANPAYGAGTKPSLAFLMAMFNVRLGVWADNPSVAPPWWLPRSKAWPLYLTRELFSRTTEDAYALNISDGGHIENLGIYELLRRRCKYIIAVDAEQDGSLRCGGLATVIRYARIDLGIEIDIDLTEIERTNDGVPGPAPHGKHWAHGAIRYPGGFAGELLYLKSSLNRDENPYVEEYRARNPEFPHESTADQFFSEEQFEAYRALGYHIANELVKSAKPVMNRVQVVELFTAARLAGKP